MVGFLFINTIRPGNPLAFSLSIILLIMLVTLGTGLIVDLYHTSCASLGLILYNLHSIFLILCSSITLNPITGNVTSSILKSGFCTITFLLLKLYLPPNKHLKSPFLPLKIVYSSVYNSINFFCKLYNC